MSQMIDAFNNMLNINARTMKIFRPGGSEQTLRVCTSNYQRNQAVVNGIVSNEREFVISQKEIDKTTLLAPKRGDKIIDNSFGVSNITSVTEMIILGQIVGYRVRGT